MYENPFYIQGEFTQNSNTQVFNKKQDLDISHFAGLNLIENRLNDSYGRQTVNPAQFASPFLYQGNLVPTTPQKKSCCGSCNGGKGCDGGDDNKGCSGGCGSGKEKLQSQNTENNTYKSDLNKTKNSNFGKDKYGNFYFYLNYKNSMFSNQKYILKQEKNSFTFGADNDIFETSSTVFNDLSLDVKIVHLKSNFEYFKMNLINKNDSWIIENTEYKIEKSTPLEAINISTSIVWATKQIEFQKYEKIKKDKDNQAQNHSPCETHGDVYFYNHDNFCTKPGSIFGGTQGDRLFGDGEHFSLWTICSGFIRIDFLECCQMHDRLLWCAENDWEIIGASESLIQCATQKALSQAYKKISWLCPWDAVLVTAEIASLWSILSVLAPIGEVVGDSASLIGYGGRHKDSCLCGGDKPTFCCNPNLNPEYCRDMNGNPRNLCDDLIEERPRCFDCSWKCKYDAEGNPIGKVVISDPNKILSCCAGTPGDKNRFKCQE
jgi:hypothetical protein